MRYVEIVVKLHRHVDFSKKIGKSESVFAEKLLKVRHCNKHHYLILIVFIKHVCPKIRPYNFHTTKIDVNEDLVWY